MDRQNFSFRLNDIKLEEHIDLSNYHIDPINSENMSLGLGITDKCNLQCPMCYYRENYQKHKATNISLKKITNILSELRYIGNIIIGLEGEPLCHPDLKKILKLCSHHTKSISIVTNGLLLSSHILDLLNHNKVINITLSCDGIDKQTYEENRVGGSFKRFCNKLQLTQQKFKGKISLHTVIHNKNCDRIINLPKFAYNHGIHDISLAQLRCNTWNSNHTLARPALSDLKKNLLLLIDQAELFKINVTFDALFGYGELLEWMKSTFYNYKTVKISSTKICLVPWIFTSILSDGRQFPCCGDFKPNNVTKYDFDSLYNNDSIKKLRYLLANNKTPAVCLNCITGNSTFPDKNL